MSGIRGTKFRVSWDSGMVADCECGFDTLTGTVQGFNEVMQLRCSIFPLDEERTLWMLNSEDDGHTFSMFIDLNTNEARSVRTIEDSGVNSPPEFMSGKLEFINWKE